MIATQFFVLRGEEFAIDGIVLDDEHTQAQRSSRHGGGSLRDVLSGWERKREMEPRPRAGCTLGFEMPAHQLHKPQADGESEAGASVAARCGCVCLREPLEKPGQR